MAQRPHPERGDAVDRSNVSQTAAARQHAVESVSDPASPDPVTEPTLADLFSGLSSDFSTLVRKEMELARVETMQTIKKAARSLVAIIASGLLAYTGLLLVLAAISIWLGGVLDSLWLGTLIVGAVVLVIGLIMYISGRGALEDLDATPERTIQSIQDDAEWAKEKVNESV